MSNVITASHIQLKYIFGLNAQIRNSLAYLDENKVIYPAGYNVVAFNTQDLSQTHFQGVEGYRSITAVALSPMRRFLAIAASGETPGIFVYDTTTQKRKKTLIYPDEGTIIEYTALAFAPGAENRQLISLTGGAGGDVLLIYWQYDKSKVQASIKISQSIVECYEIAFNPQDKDFVSVIGKNIFKCYKLQEFVDENGIRSYSLKNQFQQLSTGAIEVNQHFKCHVWMQFDSLCIAANEIGEIVLLDSECKFESVLEKSPINILGYKWEAYCIQQHQKGCLVGGQNQQIFVYKQNEMNRNRFDLTNQIQIKQVIDSREFNVVGISLTPGTEQNIICTMDNNTIYGGQFKTEDVLYDQEITLKPVSLNFHTGAINGMDVCVRKPLIVSCGTDKYIRVWNFEAKTMETQKQFTEEPFCISIHPSGLQLVAGFSDKLKMMNIILHNNQIKHFKEIPFKACREVRFSNGGQYFAAVNSSSNNQAIHIFNTYTGENPSQYIFKGHNGKIRCLLWSRDDRTLVSCGADGMIYAWKIGFDVARIFDCYNKSINYSCVALTNDIKNPQYVFAVGNDRNIRQLAMEGGEDKPNRDVGVNLSQIVFPSTNKILICGINDEKISSGAIRCYKYPMSGQFAEYQAHDEKGIEKLRITFDDQYVISAGRDGCVMLHEIKDKETRGVKIREGFTEPSDEILITRGDLDDIQQNKETLKQVYQDNLQSQSNILTLTSKDDLIKQKEEKLLQNGQQYLKRYQHLDEIKRDLESKNKEEIITMSEQFDQEIQELDTTYQKRVMQEVAKYENSKRHQDIENAGYIKALSKLNDEHKHQILQLEEEYNQKLESERNDRLRTNNEMDRLKEEYKECILQIQIETQEEISNLKEKNTTDVIQITDRGLKAKSDVSITKKKIAQQQQDAQELEDQRKDYEENKKTLQINGDKLRATIAEQKKIMEERDKMIGEKEKKIYELKKRSQELEKFKFVLDHKIKELKRDIGPREIEITKMKEETNKMDQKLKKFNTINNTLGAIVEDLDSTQGLMNKQIKKLRAHISFQNVRTKQFKDTVYQAVQYIQNYDELANQAEKIYKQFVTKDIKSIEIDPDIKAEYETQKKYLEKTEAMLKKNLLKDNEIHKQDNIRIMRENVELIKEINKLRKQLKEMKFTQKGDKGKTGQITNKTQGSQEVEIDETQEDEQLANNEKKKFIELQMNKINDLKNRIADLDAECRKLQV